MMLTLGLVGALDDDCAFHNFAEVSKLKAIVTGAEHSGTTLLSALVMSAPQSFGGFELGFLLAKNVDDWPNIHPFHESMDNWRGYDEKMLENASCHAEMYVSLMASNAISLNNQTGIVDKTPAYAYTIWTR